MLIELDYHKIIISKRIFRDKHSSKIIGQTDEEVGLTKPVIE